MSKQTEESLDEKTPRELVVDMMGTKGFIDVNRKDAPESSLLDFLEHDRLPDIKSRIDQLCDR